MFYELSWWTLSPFIRAAFKVKIKGKENLPAKGPAILASNHLSFLDHIMLPMATRRPIRFISKIQHFDRPVRGWYFRQIGVIPLRRGEGDNVAFDRALEAIRSGELFAIYPEGTRSQDGRLHKGHTGVARLAYLTGAPVIPVAMMGTFEALPKGQDKPKLVPCGVRIGTPMLFDMDTGKADDRPTLRKRTNEVMKAIRELSGQEYVEAYQYNPEVSTHRGDEHPDAAGPE